ncbi:hyperparathyroidism [Tribonema minus]|uniref:Hyperparathyroidism n=1 Tax=Tribonema minus TaxID=303371 RepID=A0A835YKD9_9STRA|nr:hyperparathyroidism [Tribonema minus]
MDALQALRQACIQGRVPTLTPEDTTVVLGDRGSPWPLDTKTSWRSASHELYTLHSLILLLQYADKPIGDYLRTAIAWKVKFVSNIDRRELLAYLKRERDTTDAMHIDKSDIS